MFMDDFKRRVGLYFTAVELIDFLDIDVFHLVDLLEDPYLLENYDDLLMEMKVDEDVGDS